MSSYYEEPTYFHKGTTSALKWFIIFTFIFLILIGLVLLYAYVANASGAPYFSYIQEPQIMMVPFEGSSFPTSSVESFQACQKLCYDLQSCQGFMYSPSSQNCALMTPSLGRPVITPLDSDVTTWLRSYNKCSEGTLTPSYVEEAGIARSGDNGTVLQNTYGLECIDACSKDSACVSALSVQSMEDPSVYTCVLYPKQNSWSMVNAETANSYYKFYGCYNTDVL